MSDPTTTDEAKMENADQVTDVDKQISDDEAQGLLACVEAAIAECERRLKVCEAQTPGEWFPEETVGYSSGAVAYTIYQRTITRGGNSIRTHVWGKENATAICAQRNERPQELRALIATLRKIDKAVPWGLTAFVEDLLDGIVRELGVRP